MKSIESSIELSKNGEIFCDVLGTWEVNSFLTLFALSATEEDYNYIKMREGMVQPRKPEVVVSFGIEVTATSFFVNNVLSSMEFEEIKKFILDILK